MSNDIELRQTGDPDAIRSLHRLFFILERLDHQAQGLPMVQVTSIMWRDQISPDIEIVRRALHSE